MKQSFGGVPLFKKLRKNDYNWIGNYIKEYNEMIAHYEKVIRENNNAFKCVIEEKDNKIKELQNEISKLKSCGVLKPRQKQISDEDINKIKKLKLEGKSYGYISKETGWSKATISRVINNKYY